MDRDEIKGKAEKAKGYVKDKTGEILDKPELEGEGEADRAAGKVRETIGRAKRKAGEAAEDIADKLEEE